jgi:hypothetical protein
MRSTFLTLLALALLAVPVGAAAYLWCVDTDEIRIEVDPATGDFTLYHDGAQYNCCPEPISYEVHFGDATLFVIEHVAADPPCNCNCCYDLSVTIPDAQPGPWQVSFTWLDVETYTWTDWHGEIIVPDVGQGYVHGEPVPSSSGCLDSTSVTQGPRDLSTWSTVKALYH